MATIRDVAKQAQVSPTTVSLVISGKAEEYRIPEATRKKVMQAMTDLGYRPNLYARKLRSRNTDERPMIAFYWPRGERTSILAMFIDAFQSELQGMNVECEFAIQTYRNDHLDESVSHIMNNEYHAVIVGGTSKRDIEFLDTLQVNIPLVVINRASATHSSVQADNFQMAQLAAELFIEKKYGEIGVIGMKKPYVATNYRMRAFMSICQESGIVVPEKWIAYSSNTLEGGLSAAKQLLSKGKLPPAIFVESDLLAQGAVRQFNIAGIRIPDEVAILAINMGPTGFMDCATPSITTVEMPSLDIAKASIATVMSAMRDVGRAPMHVSFNGKIIFRDSLPQ